MEHEITGHTRKVYKIWKNPSLPFWKKFREIGIEILIIVFAVSLAAFLEKSREHNNEQKVVKEFLLGLETDLQSDIVEMGSDKESYTAGGKIFHYLTHITPGTEPENDTIRKYYNNLFNTTALIPNNGRYEGFKSSGKINTIENKELQNDILDLYQENISNLLSSTGYYNERKQVLQTLFYESVKWKPDGTSNLNAVLATDKARNISYSLSAVEEILSRYDSVINKSKKIIAAIEHEYK